MIYVACYIVLPHRIVAHMMAQSALSSDIKNLILQCRPAIQRLRVAAEQMKCDLATSIQSSRAVTLPRLSAAHGEGLIFEARLNRVNLECITSPFIRKTMVLVDKAVSLSLIPLSKIKNVVLVGGSSRLLLVRSTLAKRFPHAIMRTELNPDTIVAHGAAMLAAQLLFNNGDLVHDVSPLGLGVRMRGDIMSVSDHHDTGRVRTRAKD